MITLRFFFLLSLLLVVSAVLAAEPTPSEALDQVIGETAAEHALKHLDPTYVCPMHPQIIRGEPGNCPICGMRLVPVQPGSESGAGQRKILYYRHPHDPTITSDKPMKDEMGMDFVPVYEEGGVQVTISPSVVQNMGVRTAAVERGRLWRRIDTVGYVDFDEELLSHVHLRTEGWIERLTVKSEGERVKRGDLLFELYSPTLVNAQEEYLQALVSSSSTLSGASRDRLVALGVSRDQIAQLRSSRKVRQVLKVYAGHAGIVAKLNVREGMFVKPATEVMTLADLSRVWLLAEVFEGQADWVKVGAPAEVRLSYRPGRTWEGKVEFVYPSLDAATRTLRARLSFPNPDEALKPNMFADVTLYGGAHSGVLMAPREALIRTGVQDRVILALGEGRFKPREVKAGMESGDWVEILEGVREGEKVVTSGQFLIDSEASLKASILRLSDASSHLKAGEGQVMGTGVIKALMPEKGKLTMAHDPIEAIGWPSMTMDFQVKSGVSLEGLSLQDPVIFQLEKGEDGYVVSAIRRDRP